MHEKAYTKSIVQKCNRELDCRLLLKFTQILYRNVAHDMLFLETSNPLKSSYDAWDST